LPYRAEESSSACRQVSHPHAGAGVSFNPMGGVFSWQK
jgi:hypothetical protein